jgi:hypothetical protein
MIYALFFVVLLSGHQTGQQRPVEIIITAAPLARTCAPNAVCAERPTLGTDCAYTNAAENGEAYLGDIRVSLEPVASTNRQAQKNTLLLRWVNRTGAALTVPVQYQALQSCPG